MGQKTKCQLKFWSNEMVISRNENGIGQKAPPEKFAEYRREPVESKAFSSEILAQWNAPPVSICWVKERLALILFPWFFFFFGRSSKQCQAQISKGRASRIRKTYYNLFSGRCTSCFSYGFVKQLDKSRHCKVVGELGSDGNKQSKNVSRLCLGQAFAHCVFVSSVKGFIFQGIFPTKIYCLPTEKSLHKNAWTSLIISDNCTISK